MFELTQSACSLYKSKFHQLAKYTPAQLKVIKATVLSSSEPFVSDYSLLVLTHKVREVNITLQIQFVKQICTSVPSTRKIKYPALSFDVKTIGGNALETKQKP